MTDVGRIAQLTETAPSLVARADEKPPARDAAYWRKLAVDAGERLKIQETQLKDLRVAADEARARVTKYKGRLENAQERVNELQSKLIAASAAVDQLRDQLARQEIVKRKVYEFRQSLIDGPIWELFAEFCRDVGRNGPADEGAQP